MAKQKIKTESVSSQDALQHWERLVKLVSRGDKRVIVSEGGVPAVAIISITDLEWLLQDEARRADLWTAIDRIRERNKDIDPDEVERDIAAAIREVRREAAEQNRGQSHP